jgi:exodeoxyribonuclease VII large subunit
VRAIAACPVPVISAVGHETDVSLADLAADVRAPTPSAAAEMVAASREELLARVQATRAAMESALSQRLQRVRLLLDHFAPENLERNVRLLLQPFAQRLDDARDELSRRIRDAVTSGRHRLELAARELSSYSPLAILDRGYAVVTHDPSHRVLLSPEGVQRGDAVSIRLARGRMRAAVEETDAGEKH